MTRRDLLTACGALLVVTGTACAGGCERSGARADLPERAEPPTPREGPRRSVHAGVEIVELFPQGADATAPLVVAIHGRGDHPDNWVETWRAFPARVHVALPRAFDPFGDGFSWFLLEDRMSDGEIAASLGGAEKRLWPALAELAGRRPIFVTGFSQGGMLSFALAARHPEEIAHAFPVAGAAPPSLLPPPGARAAPVTAFHGTSDRVIPFDWGKETVDALARSGHVATMRPYRGVAHTMTRAMHEDLVAEMQKALPRGAGQRP